MKLDRYYAAFSPRRIGEISINVTNDGDGKNYVCSFNGSVASVSTSAIAHSFYHGTMGDLVIDLVTYPLQRAPFATALAAELNALATAAASAVTWTVAWSNATLRYTITSAGGAGVPAITVGDVAQGVLGMPSGPTPVAGVFTSSVRPKYVLPTETGATSNNSGDQHTRGQVRSVMTDSGRQFGIGPTTRAVVHRWQQRHELRAATFRWDSVGVWTYQDLFDHCGAWEPILAIPSATLAAPLFADATMRFNLHGPDADFMPSPTFLDFDNRWDIPFAAVVTHRKLTA